MADLKVEDITVQGTCNVYFAFIVGSQIDLDRAATLSNREMERVGLKRERRASRFLDFEPRPLQITVHGREIAIEEVAKTIPAIELTLFDFGAVSVHYRIPMPKRLVDSALLSATLYDCTPLMVDARTQVEELVQVILPAVEARRPAEDFEQYVVFEISETTPDERPQTLIKNSGVRQALSQIILSETGAVSKERQRDALGRKISYGDADMLIVDWASAMLFGTAVEDELAVLEFANVELLELRLLDSKLDRHLDEAYRIEGGRLPMRMGRALRRVSQLEVDAAMLYESVDNAIKFLGDQYLAHVYRLIAERYDLAQWDRSIERKIAVLSRIYQTLSDRAAHLRSELLELTIVLLIVFEIVMAFWK